ncbi:hypothetical protein [Terriglobus sp. RCC_193]|uniref:hypothetical protein n=1 Tax=Terriglobus sp. RCC_193 TaxID=3239218 RepID=UPI003524F006
MSKLTNAIEEVKTLLDRKKEELVRLDYESLLIEIEEACDIRWRELNPAGGKFIDRMIATGQCEANPLKR